MNLEVGPGHWRNVTKFKKGKVLREGDEVVIIWKDRTYEQRTVRAGDIFHNRKVADFEANEVRILRYRGPGAIEAKKARLNTQTPSEQRARMADSSGGDAAPP